MKFLKLFLLGSFLIYNWVAYDEYIGILIQKKPGYILLLFLYFLLPIFFLTVIAGKDKVNKIFAIIILLINMTAYLLVRYNAYDNWYFIGITSTLFTFFVILRVIWSPLGAVKYK